MKQKSLLFKLIMCVLALAFIAGGLIFIKLQSDNSSKEEIPIAKCIGLPSSIRTVGSNNAAVNICDYNTAHNGTPGWINHFGRVSVRSSADKDSDVICYTVYKNAVGTFGEEKNGFYLSKYYDALSGKTYIGYIHSDYISREEPVSAQIYLDVPSYTQTDERWSDIKIGGYETLGSAGCTTTCLAMAYSCIKKETVLPSDMAAALYYDYDGNLKFPDEFIKLSNRTYLQDIYNALSTGVPVLVGCFKPSGFPHWCVVYAYNGDGTELKKEDFLVHDPYKSDRSTLQEFFDVFPIFNKIAYYNTVTQ
ncbi:MAG: C39 family peptidase [Lachnospiraceae bacterium]|nr:C39 family peptidase [Lachnospiraceae bacterium]